MEIWGQVKDELYKIYVLNKILSKLDFVFKNTRTLVTSDIARGGIDKFIWTNLILF